MEQRKVLLIIVSVAIILAAIIGVGIWLFYPRAEAEPDQIAEAGGGLEWEPLDYLRGDGEVPELEADEESEGEDLVVTYGVAEEEAPRDGRPGIVTEEPAPASERDTAAATGAEETARAPVGRDDTAAPQPAVEADAAPARTVTTTPSSAAAQQDRKQSTQAPTQEPPATAAERTAPARSATREEELSDRAYWVQAISSPNRDTIEQAQRTLREHQLGTRVLTKEIGGTLYYRLRLGPFAVREEAEKFLGWVTEIDGFTDAMIFVDYTTAVLAAGG